MWAEVIALAKGEGIVNLGQGAPDFTGADREGKEGARGEEDEERLRRAFERQCGVRQTTREREEEEERESNNNSPTTRQSRTDTHDTHVYNTYTHTHTHSHTLLTALPLTAQGSSVAKEAVAKVLQAADTSPAAAAIDQYCPAAGPSRHAREARQAHARVMRSTREAHTLHTRCTHTRAALG